MTAPQRIQRQRTPGWRMPPNTVYVGRPTQWGNPWGVTRPGTYTDVVHVDTASEAVTRYEQAIRDNDAGARFHHGLPTSAAARAVLAGKNLACWCPPNQPCHADVLLTIANANSTTHASAVLPTGTTPVRLVAVAVLLGGIAHRTAVRITAVLTDEPSTTGA